MADLLRSPLHDRHVALGAKLADFGGWEMPIEYAASGGGVLKEHAAVREAVGVFDDLVRISNGIEEPEDLVRDVQQALERAVLQMSTRNGTNGTDSANGK